MNKELQQKIDMATKTAAEARALLNKLSGKVLFERAADFCEFAWTIDQYAIQAQKAKGAALADLMFRMGALAGRLEYEIYEVTDQREERRLRNKRFAEVARTLATVTRVEALEKTHGRDEAVRLVADEQGVTPRQIRNRLSFPVPEDLFGQLDGYREELPWFAEYEKHARRFHK